MRNSATGEMIDRQTLGPVRDNEQLLDDYLTENGLENVDVLVAMNDGCDVTGDFLGMVAAEHGRVPGSVRDVSAARRRCGQVPIADQFESAGHRFDAPLLSPPGDHSRRTTDFVPAADHDHQ